MKENRVTSGVDRFLTFMLGDEEYALGVRYVQSIIGILPFTSVPGHPDYVLGVINLRGAILPVIDLKRRLGMPPRDITHESCIVVVQVKNAVLGLLADRVREVVSIPEDTVQHPPKLGPESLGNHVIGVAATEAGARILLDVEAVVSGGLSLEELSSQ